MSIVNSKQALKIIRNACKDLNVRTWGGWTNGAKASGTPLRTVGVGVFTDPTSAKVVARKCNAQLAQYNAVVYVTAPHRGRNVYLRAACVIA